MWSLTSVPFGWFFCYFALRILPLTNLKRKSLVHSSRKRPKPLWLWTWHLLEARPKNHTKNSFVCTVRTVSLKKDSRSSLSPAINSGLRNQRARQILRNSLLTREPNGKLLVRLNAVFPDKTQLTLARLKAPLDTPSLSTAAPTARQNLLSITLKSSSSIEKVKCLQLPTMPRAPIRCFLILTLP